MRVYANVHTSAQAMMQSCICDAMHTIGSRDAVNSPIWGIIWP